MRRLCNRAVIVLFVAVLLSACSRTPDHMQYIPKDAVAVAGINLKGLGKKIAWNVITGSKLFKEMEQRAPQQNTKDAMSGIEKAGIDVLNTFYVYVKTDTRMHGNNRITGLVPLSDAGAWEAYLKQLFPKLEIKQNGDRKEASLGTGMYAGWNKHLLILINVIPGGDEDAAGSTQPDMAMTAAEMDNAFKVAGENSIATNPRFVALDKEGHDLTFWLNYDQMMSQYMSGDVAQRMGVALSGNLWKDAAFTAGFDFVKGKITGDMRYYMSQDMKDVCQELGSTNADKDMIERLPKRDLDMLMTVHLSPKGVKDMMDKMGTLGLVNVSLQTQGLDADHVLDAFTGDMALVLHGFSLKAEKVTDSFMGQSVMHQSQKPSGSVSYVMKINNKADFQKLADLAKQSGLLTMNNGFYIPIDDKDSIYILMNDQYLVATNKYADGMGFLDGSFKPDLLPADVAAHVVGFPQAVYVDVQQFFKNIDPGISTSAHDSAMIAESKKLLSNISVTGGAYKDDAFQWHLDVNFTNTDENSIIELMDYGMRMSDASKSGQ